MMDARGAAKIRWLSVCVSVLRQGDATLSEVNASELAGALWDRPSVRGFDPDMVAEMLLRQRRGSSERRTQEQEWAD